MISRGPRRCARYTAAASAPGYLPMRRSLLLSLCLAAAPLAGCGNKGPLYLPDNPHPPVYVPPKAAPAPASTQAAPAPAGTAPVATH